MIKSRILVLFGSRSVEHEVSVVTAMQVMENLNKDKYEVVPVYIDKEGKWWSGEKLLKMNTYKDLSHIGQKGLSEYKLSGLIGDKKLVPVKPGLFKKNIEFDMIFLAIHGTYGEDGTVQGMLEILKLPYTGCGVTASAVGMDKVIQKQVFRDQGIPVVNFEWFNINEYNQSDKEIIGRIEKNLGYPVFVKPANLGSSVGISMASNKKELINAIDVAKEFDRKIIVEQGLPNIDEINCSVIGLEEDVEASACEQPIKNNKLLSYVDKYMSAGTKTKGMKSLSRLLPAPIGEEMTKKIQDYSKLAFQSISGSGLARLDFLVDIKKKKIFLNEINTLPGSLAFYLWEEKGTSFKELLDRLIDLGWRRFDRRNNINFSFDSGLLSKPVKGIKKLN